MGARKLFSSEDGGEIGQLVPMIAALESMARKLRSALYVRCLTIVSYVQASPGFAQTLPWLKLGLVKSRLMSGARCRRSKIALDTFGRFYCNLDAGVVAEMDVFHEVVIERNYPLEKLPFTPVLVADCGANIGLFSCVARVAYPDAKIYAWEADQRNFRRLAEQPALRQGNTELFYAAVSDRSGQVEMSGSGTGCEVMTPRSAANQVDCIDFGDWWKQHAEPGSLLKIDIEGHETALLPALSGRWRAPCAVFLETHAAGGRDEKTVDKLREAGFEVELLRSHSLSGDERIFKEYFALLR